MNCYATKTQTQKAFVAKTIVVAGLRYVSCQCSTFRSRPQRNNVPLCFCLYRGRNIEQRRRDQQTTTGFVADLSCLILKPQSNLQETEFTLKTQKLCAPQIYGAHNRRLHFFCLRDCAQCLFNTTLSQNYFNTTLPQPPKVRVLPIRVDSVVAQPRKTETFKELTFSVICTLNGL